MIYGPDDKPIVPEYAKSVRTLVGFLMLNAMRGNLRRASINQFKIETKIERYCI